MRRYLVTAAVMRLRHVRPFLLRATRQPLLCEKNMIDRTSDVTHEDHYGGGKVEGEREFDMATLVYLGDGIETGFMDEVRDCLIRHTKSSAACFTLRKEWSHAECCQILREIIKTCNISYGDYEHTPRRFWALFEVLATCDAALALIAADHFMFAHLAATRGTSKAREKILIDADHVGSLGAIAVLESHSDIAGPYLMDAHIDYYERCVVLSGTGKMAVVNGTTAKWAYITANVSKGKNEKLGSHAFFVQLRNSKGELMEGVSMKAIEHDGVDRLGMAVVHFNHVRVGRDFIARPSYWNDHAEIVRGTGEGETKMTDSVDELLMARRLIAGSIYSGTMKRTFTNMINFFAKRKAMSAFGKKTFHILGFQFIQTPVCEIGSGVFAVQYAWQVITNIFSDKTKTPTGVQEMELHSVLHFLLKHLCLIESFSLNFMTQHAMFHSTGLSDIRLVTSYLAEGDTSFHARKAGREILYHTTSSEMSFYDRLVTPRGAMGKLKRLFRNPGFSPVSPVPQSHLRFFRMKYLEHREKLRSQSNIEERLFGPEDLWYFWNCSAHRDVVRCGESLGEWFILDHFSRYLFRLQDAPTQRFLGQLFLFFSISRLEADKQHLCATGHISHHQANEMQPRQDKVSFKVAPSLHRATVGLRVPDSFLAPAHTGLDAYWAIPGTITNVERGDSVVVSTPTNRKSERKSDQEKIVEEDEEFDILHGLGGEAAKTQHKA